MKLCILPFIALPFLLAACGNGDNPVTAAAAAVSAETTKLVSDQAAEWKNATAAIANVTDEASAKTAEPALTSVAEKLKDLIGKVKENPAAIAAAAGSTDLKSNMGEFAAKLSSITKTSPKAAEIIKNILTKFGITVPGL